MLKNIFINITSIILLTSAQLSTAAQNQPNFEFYNKDEANGRVKITVMVDGKNIVVDKIVDADEAWQATVNPQKPVMLTIFTTNQKNIYYVLNAPGKTKYLSWNTAKSTPLYPQTGPVGGLMGKYNPFGMGKTESGLPLNNNLNQSQILRK